MSRSKNRLSAADEAIATAAPDVEEKESIDSSDLPANVVRVKGSPFLYIYAPTSAGGRKRIVARIRDDGRGRKLASAVLTRLEGLQQDAAHRRVLDYLHERKIGLFANARRWPGLPGLDDVAAKGLDAVGELLKRLEADAHDVDLSALVEKFATDPVSLHTRKRGLVMKSNARTNDAAHVRAALDWCAYDLAEGESGWLTLANISDRKQREREYERRLGKLGAERRVSLLEVKRVSRYLDHVLARERVKKPEQPTAGRSARRKHQLALRTFIRWLQVRSGMAWVVDPTNDVILESTPAGRILHLERWEIELLAATLDELAAPHGDYCLIQHGTGLDSTDVARIEVRDVDRASRRIRSLSGKTFNRKRQVLVLDWAWPAVERRIAGKRPTDRLFHDLPPDRHAHAKAMEKARDHLVQQGHLQFRGYQARDARHSVAVMMLAAGVPVKAVARQLGNDPGTLLRTYAEWIPDASDEDLWRVLMNERDTRKRAEAEGR